MASLSYQQPWLVSFKISWLLPSLALDPRSRASSLPVLRALPELCRPTAPPARPWSRPWSRPGPHPGPHPGPSPGPHPGPGPCAPLLPSPAAPPPSGPPDARAIAALPGSPAACASLFREQRSCRTTRDRVLERDLPHLSQYGPSLTFPSLSFTTRFHMTCAVKCYFQNATCR